MSAPRIDRETLDAMWPALVIVAVGTCIVTIMLGHVQRSMESQPTTECVHIERMEEMQQDMDLLRVRIRVLEDCEGE